jgi:hypothetical protein
MGLHVQSPGVPSAHRRQYDAGVRLYRQDCVRTRALDLEAVIRRLQARGADGRAGRRRGCAGSLSPLRGMDV